MIIKIKLTSCTSCWFY